MKVLITGSRGLVGASFAKRLSQYNPTCIDIKDGNDAIDFFNKDNTKYDLVIHAAATVGGRKTIELAPEKLFNNFVLDSGMLQWALKTKPKSIAYFSSSAAYPNSLQKKYLNGNDEWKNIFNTYKLKEGDIDLDTVESPDPSIYGWSKLTGEQLVRYVSNQLNIWVFRPFSGYSHIQDLDYPFPAFIHRAVHRQDPFEIWGDGTQVRDWIHMNDVVETVLACISMTEPDTFNICTGRPVSFNQFADMVTNMIGYKPRFKHILGAPTGVHYRVGDPIKSHKIYVPEIAFESGIEKALREMV